MTYNTGEKLVCPHCFYTYAEPVEDFAIPGRVGLESMAEEKCEDCEQPFEVLANGDGTFDVQKSEE